MSQPARKVTYARLHAPTFIPVLGNLKDALPPDNKSLDMQLSWDGSMLNGTAFAHGQKVSFGVPASALQIVVFAPETKTTTFTEAG